MRFVLETNNSYIVGIDLAGSEKHPTGICILDENSLSFYLFKAYRNDEILSKIKDNVPRGSSPLIVFDAPLTWSGEPYREKDRAASIMGARLLPMSLPSMQMLYRRALTLLDIIRKVYPESQVFETHPTSLARLLGFREKTVIAQILGLEGLSKDETDALLCCIAGRLYKEGIAELVGREHPIILPSRRSHCTFVFDIDGVLIDISDRINAFSSQHRKTDFYSRDLVELDRPRETGIKILRERLLRGRVVIVTGRPVRTMSTTLRQLKSFGVPLEHIEEIVFRNTEEDPSEWKKRTLQILSEKYDICEVHEDDEGVLEYIKKKLKGAKPVLHRGEHVEAL